MADRDARREEDTPTAAVAGGDAHPAVTLRAAFGGAQPLTAPERPELTMPAAEAALLRRHYEAARVILEYGSGGSTVLAAEMAGKTVTSVESDRGWVEMMKAWFRANPPASVVQLHHADIGPTAGWGRPADESAFRKWPGYALSVWGLRGFKQPDVVLVDGRFRPACLMTVALRTTKPVTVLFDDYTGRRAYHTVEALLKPAEIVGRMARFEVEPMTLPPKRLDWLVGLYQRPL